MMVWAVTLPSTPFPYHRHPGAGLQCSRVGLGEHLDSGVLGDDGVQRGVGVASLGQGVFRLLRGQLGLSL